MLASLIVTVNKNSNIGKLGSNKSHTSFFCMRAPTLQTYFSVCILIDQSLQSLGLTHSLDIWNSVANLGKARSNKSNLKKTAENSEKGMKVNVSKTKVTVFEKAECVTVCNVMIDGQRVHDGQPSLVNSVTKCCSHLVTLFTRDGKNEEDIERTVNAGNKVNGALEAFMNSRNVSKKACLAVHNGVLESGK